MSELHYVIRESPVKGEVAAPPSKSITHRLAICAGLAKGHSIIKNLLLSDDIHATLDGLSVMGASVDRSGDITIEGIGGKISNGFHKMDCRESGTTLRLLLPVACALGGKWIFTGRGRLPKRRMKELIDSLCRNGATIDSYSLPITATGELKSGDFKIPGNVSSQFISGLLLALPLLKGNSTITVTGKLESAPYVGLTLDVMKAAGIEIRVSDDLRFYEIKGDQAYLPVRATVGGDYSSASFMMGAGVMTGDITIHGLKKESPQGDAKVIGHLKRMGADINFTSEGLDVKKSELHAIDINAADTPDAVPILAAVATSARGVTRIFNASRLRDKESDRLFAIAKELGKMGADIKEEKDGLTIKGPASLNGAMIDPHGDHRIAMACSVAALTAKGRTEIRHPECISKSYPGFFNDLESLGADILPATNGFGQRFHFSIYGSSHGKRIGTRIIGVPKGIRIDNSFIKEQLDLRKSVSGLGTSRREKDEPIIISGVENNLSTGREIIIELENMDVRSPDYQRHMARPGHADYTAWEKYKGILDMSGGSFFSGRMSACLVIAGAIAKSMLGGIRIRAFTRSVGGIGLYYTPDEEQISKAYQFDTRCPDDSVSHSIRSHIEECRKESDSVGGIVECRIYGLPPGLGEPFFGSLEAVVSHALFSIPAVKGVESGEGFSLAGMRGSESNDRFFMEKGKVVTKSNNCGGILGGISNGMPLVFRCAIKPTPSIGIPQKSVDLAKKRDVIVKTHGRHDPCIAIRAPVIVESMCAVALADLLLRCG